MENSNLILISFVEPKNLFNLGNIYFYDNMRKVSWILVAVIFIYYFVTNPVSFSVIAEPWPTVTIEAEPQAEVDVSPGSRCLTTVTGNVTCNSSTLDDVTVRLSLERDKCRGVLSPPVMYFEGIGTETKDLRVNISLSMKTSSYERPTATIIGTWEQGVLSGEVEPFTIQVIVLPYNRASIRLYGPREVIAGESTAFPIRIHNEGNLDDRYRMEVVNLDKLKSDGITVELIEDMDIKRDYTVDLDVNVRTSSDTPVKVHRIDIITTSLELEEPKIYEYSLYLRVKSRIIQILTNPLTLIIMFVVIITLIVAILRKGKAPISPNPK